ncbi:DUF5009 domain-containing protein [Deminuibacter soli]|uniref:DUF5009 domain-containing protein n=1 Tax=Deminuibacter soli TaxID=2291815 RepID=A0A3E1NQU0_9BACT|nr:DUF5009 domain-containing protein [Deminuibacter soli]RFM30158.1 DUF5009 domain-containing protein [Deminuibacter soli]
MKPLYNRQRSIDVFRAITMLLMVFVNDADTVRHIPSWIEHAKPDEDALGLADTVFPAFLFIVGLSLPLAINNRLKRGEPVYKIAWYIIVRAFALIVMGFYHVNLEEFNETYDVLRPVWEFGITAAFFLIWLDYPPAMPKARRYVLQGIGVAILIILAVLYKGGTDEAPQYLQTSWWGILGLIGWAYGTGALIYLFSKGRFWVQVAAAVFFFVFSLLVHAHIISDLNGLREYIWPGGNGAMLALVMAGVVVSGIYAQLFAQNNPRLFALLITLAAVCIITGFIVRPLDGISKDHDTPAWVAICTGISIAFFALLIWLIDIKNKQHWFKLIMPAGTSTLTCYLLPYFLYSIYYYTDFRYPHAFNNGATGLLRAAAVAFGTVLLTGVLEKKRLRLKV